MFHVVPFIAIFSHLSTCHGQNQVLVKLWDFYLMTQLRKCVLVVCVQDVSLLLLLIIKSSICS